MHPNIIKSLLDNWTKDKQTKEGSYRVVIITPSGKQRGCFVLRYNFGHDTIRGAPRKDDENLIRTCSTWSWQLLQSRPPYIKTAPWRMSWIKGVLGNAVQIVFFQILNLFLLKIKKKLCFQIILIC